MKIGIMTMHRIPNYGSFMQALSLKRMIESMGHQVVFVDYHIAPDVDHRRSVTAQFLAKMRTAKREVVSTQIGMRLYERYGNKVVRERNKVMFAGNHLLGVSEKRNYLTSCDVLIIGSDEVFNCLQSGNNVGYSLELFGKNARASRVVSYAASFGNTTLSRLRDYGVEEEVGKLLLRFDSVSVRDRNSYGIVKSLTGHEPSLHLDPVLVGNVELMKWRQPEQRAPYVILYGYANRFSEQECRDIILDAHSRGFCVIALGENQLICDEHVRCQPDELLGYFANAQYIITDTFHGTIFSVLCHKPFLVIPRAKQGIQGGNEEKIWDLAYRLGIEERVVETINTRTLVEKDEQPIEYSKIDAIRIAEHARTQKYLSRCFSM